MRIHITRNDQQEGPYTMEEIKGLLDSGAISLITLSFQEGTSEWVPLKTILDSQIYILLNNQKEGPYNLEQVQDLLDSGLVFSETLAWVEGTADWVPLSSILSSIANTKEAPKSSISQETTKIHVSKADQLLAQIRSSPAASNVALPLDSDSLVTKNSRPKISPFRMKYVLAIFACLGIFILFAIGIVLLNTKGLGAIGGFVMLFIMIVVWREITGEH